MENNREYDIVHIIALVEINNNDNTKCTVPTITIMNERIFPF